jgi:tetratricopeptide (TPR) repeat protein
MKLVAFIFCAALAAQSPEGFDAIVQRADAARDAHQVDQAVALYQQALHLKPGWRQGWWVLGSILYDANRYAEGDQAFLPLTTLDAEKSPGWAMAGLCEFEIQHYQDAFTHLQKAQLLGLPPSLYDVVEYHIDLILIRSGQFDRAMERITRIAGRKGDNPRLAVAMGIAGLRRAVLPTDLPASDRDLVMALGRAMCDAAASRTKDANAEFEALLAQYPSLPELHYLYGLVLLESYPDKALAAFQQELKLSPRHAPALISMAGEYVKRNDFQGALQCAQKAVDDEPRYFAAHAMLGKVLVEGGLDLQKGIQELETAVELEPANPQSRVALASAYLKAGRKEDAAKERAEFLRLRTEIDASNKVQVAQ